MDKINRTYICKDNTYIIINYTTDEKINKDKLIVLDEIFNKLLTFYPSYFFLL